MNSCARFESIKYTIKSLNKIILLSRITILISIIYVNNKLLENRDLFFELSYTLSLSLAEEVYIYIIDIFFYII